MSQFLHIKDNDDTKAIAISQVFSKNSKAKNAGYQHIPVMQCF